MNKGNVEITSENTSLPITFENCTASGNGGAICQNGGSTMTLKNVTFGADGDADKACTGTNGGAVYTAASSTVGLTNVKAYGKGSSANTATSGSAIYVNKNDKTSSAALTVNGGEFKDLKASTNGGAIYAAKDVTVEGSGTAFVNCSAAGSTDPNNSKSGGGAIYQAGGATMTLTNVTFGESGAEDKGCSASGEQGMGGAIYTTATTSTLTDCSFYYCHTTGYHSSGGALLYNNKNGNLSLYGCVFVDCTVNNTVSSSTSSLTKPVTSGPSAQTEKMLLMVTTPSLKRSMSRRQSTKR